MMKKYVMQQRQKLIRREFIGSSVAPAAAFTIVPSCVIGRFAPSNKINVAFIGTGGQGTSNIRGLIQLPD